VSISSFSRRNGLSPGQSALWSRTSRRLREAFFTPGWGCPDVDDLDLEELALGAYHISLISSYVGAGIVVSLAWNPSVVAQREQL
jgi:hypothetical protein